jgi:hypothetical protein
VVFPLYQNSPALQVDFFVKEKFTSKALEELDQIKDQIVLLNLSGMPVTDEDLKTISSFSHLEKLNINFSDVSGKGIAHLKSLTMLRSLALSGTEIEAKHLEPMLLNPSLKEVFIWNTKISETDKSYLATQYPGVEFVTTQFVDDRILKLSRPVLVNDGFLGQNELVVLRHSMPGVVIHYTLDDSNPDSLSDLVYDKPFKLNTATKLRTLGCKPGWYCSDIFETTLFTRGYKPLKAELLSPADKQYNGEGSKSLIDERKGFVDVLKEPSWLGFRDNAFEAEFDFGSKPPKIKEIILSYGKNLGSSAFPPSEVSIYGGKNRYDLKLIKTIKIKMPIANDASRVEALPMMLGDVDYPYYKVMAKPVDKLPGWHSSKGKKGWIFIDEIFFY